MNSTELFNEFIKFERKYDVFSLKTKSNIYWWDIVRFSIYYELRNTLVIKYSDQQVGMNQKNPILILKKIGKDIFYLFKSLFFKRKSLFFLCSRSKNNADVNIDIIANKFLKVIPSNESFIIETVFDANTEYSSYSNIFLIIIRKIKKLKLEKINFDINRLLNSHFETSVDFYTIVQKCLHNYTLEYKNYIWLLRLVKPQYCFVIQNGIQKALFSAAKDLNIKCIELQHGQINNFHIAYSYSNKIDYSHLKSFPNILFTFSDFWNKVNYPVNEKISMGVDNNPFEVENIITKDIAFIFSNSYAENLLSFLKKLAPQFENKIYVKLHPKQNNGIEYLKKELAEFKNIKLIYMGKTMDETLSLVSSIVMIQSTVIYEALQKNKKVFLYKKQDYATQSDVFDNPNVYLIDSVEEFITYKDELFKNQNKISYFDDFNQDKFLSYIKDYK
jgi:hypothetical protein